MDASNESALSRIWGGIHPPVDDAPARQIGSLVGVNAFHYAETIVFPEYAMEYGGEGFVPSNTCSGDFDYDHHVGTSDFILFLAAFGSGWTGPYDINGNEVVGTSDLLILLTAFGTDCQ